MKAYCTKIELQSLKEFLNLFKVFCILLILVWKTENEFEEILLFTNDLVLFILKYFVSREEIFWKKLRSGSISALIVRLLCTEKGLRIQNKD